MKAAAGTSRVVARRWRLATRQAARIGARAPRCRQHARFMAPAKLAMAEHWIRSPQAYCHVYSAKLPSSVARCYMPTKRTRARVALGATTSTGDSEGGVLERRPVSVTRTDVDRVIKGLVGPITQVPPMYSALKHEGRPSLRVRPRGRVSRSRAADGRDSRTDGRGLRPGVS